MIARILEGAGIAFEYEAPLAIHNPYGDGKTRIWRPDFHLPTIGGGMRLEYAGFPDDPDYMRGIARKKRAFKENGIKALFLYPTDLWRKTLDGQYRKRSDVTEHVLGKIHARAKQPLEKRVVPAVTYPSGQWDYRPITRRPGSRLRADFQYLSIGRYGH